MSETNASAARPDAPRPDADRLEELDDQIRQARSTAEDALGDDEHQFVESGSERSESMDDQTIAPPG